MGSSLSYKHLFEVAPFGMVVMSMDGRIQAANAAFCEALGYGAAELQGLQHECLLYPSQSENPSPNTYGEVVKNNEAGILRTKYIKKDKSLLEVFYKKAFLDTNLEQSSDIVLQIVEIINDFKVEEVIVKESGLFDALINSFPNEIFIKNRESQFIRVNEANLIKLNQPSLESVVGKTDFDFFDIAHAQKAYDDEQQIIRTGIPILNFEEKEVFPDGRVSFINTSKMPLINNDGEIIGTFGVSQDITERKIHELKLKEQTSIMNAIVAKIPVVIFKYNKNKGIHSTIGNNEIKKAFEASRMAKLKIGDSLNHFVDKIGKHKDKNGYYSFSSTSKINKKERYFENFIFKGHSDHSEYIGLALDDTERRMTEQKLKRDARDMEKVNKELNQFAYIISHDLKAPLRAITNLSEWIEEDLLDYKNPEVKEQLKLLRGRVSRMENLINGILKYSRLTRAEILFEKIEVTKLIEEIKENIMVKESFIINSPKLLPNINFSKIHLEQVFTNLLSNCIKHHDKEKGIIDIEYKEVNGMHEFMVGDDGPGIAPEYHQKVFQIFQTLQARDAFESTGIGLTIVKKIIEEQGGGIRIDSKEGNGCKVYFTLPKVKI